MKQCPTCQSLYTDDTLQFCLQDGSLLQTAPGSQDAAADYGEQETVVAGRPSNQISAPPVTNATNWNPDQHLSNAAVRPPEKKSKATVAVFLTAFVMLLLFSFVGIGAWLYFRGATPDDKGNLFITKKSPVPETANRTTTVPVDSSKPTPAGTPLTSSSSNANTAADSAPVDKELIKKEVSQQIDSWKSGTESGNIDSYINLYARRLEYYYTKRGVSRSSVRRDKQNAFNQYSEVQINLSNLSITPDDSGEKATAVFDKQWVFDGERRFEGKAQSQMQFEKVGDQWLITGERDLKVY